MDITTKPAAQLQIGDSIVERDGAVLTIDEVSIRAGRVHLTCSSTMSQRIHASVRTTSLVRVANNKEQTP